MALAKKLTEAEREALADACDAAYDFGDTWIRFLRSGNEDMLLPVVERIVAARIEDALVTAPLVTPSRDALAEAPRDADGRAWLYLNDDELDEACCHDWLLRPESDTYVCLICGDER